MTKAILEAARRVAGGELPYRDFHFMYTPGTVYLLAFILRMGGQFHIVARHAAVLVSIFGITYSETYKKCILGTRRPELCIADDGTSSYV